MADHLSGYQARDWEVVDYEMYEEPSSGLQFRGPRPELKPGADYFVCLGAAQTLGCFCERPYASLLSERLGIAGVNLGYGGAGPRFYLRHPELMTLINGARFVVLQVMSARSEDNSVFESGGLEYLKWRSNGQRVSAADGYQAVLDRADAGLRLPPKAKKLLRAFRGPEAAVALVRETQRNWTASNVELLRSIHVPVVLFWFSKRRPWLQRSTKAFWWWQRYDNANAMFGEYPQLVTRGMVRAIQPFADSYVECVTSRGAPQRVYSRFTGKAVEVDYGKDRLDLAETSPFNHYYPSPEMHEDAAQALLGPCEKHLIRPAKDERR